MLIYVFKEKDGEWYYYWYYPDGNMDAPGIVRLNRFNEGHIISRSPEDYPNGKYGYKAILRIDVAKEKGTIAWY